MDKEDGALVNCEHRSLVAARWGLGFFRVLRVFGLLCCFFSGCLRVFGVFMV